MEKRNTIQKSLVLEAVQALKCHATAEEIYNSVCKKYPSVSKGTVYRNLKVLVDEGKIQRTEIPGEVDRFDHTLKKHYHCQCVKCSRVFDVELLKNPDILKLVKNDNGFEFSDFDIIFKGICPNCKEEK